MTGSVRRSATRWVAAATGLAVLSYGAYVGLTWLRYGKRRPAADGGDAMLDSFMPDFEVVERHKIWIAAPPETVFSAAAELDLHKSRIVSGIFKAREWILGSESDDAARPTGFLREMKSLGWGVLAETPGRAIVVGAATKPWEPNPVFRALPPEEFGAFREPGYVKIVWTLRADPDTDGSMFRTETRAVATDEAARRRFRGYWALLSPGIILIRVAMLPAVKREAERRRSAGVAAGFGS